MPLLKVQGGKVNAVTVGKEQYSPIVYSVELVPDAYESTRGIPGVSTAFESWTSRPPWQISVIFDIPGVGRFIEYVEIGQQR